MVLRYTLTKKYKEDKKRCNIVKKTEEEDLTNV